MTGSTPGAAAFYTVWQGRSCSWSRSPAKPGLLLFRQSHQPCVAYAWPLGLPAMKLD
jgi:hypothetical protein